MLEHGAFKRVENLVGRNRSGVGNRASKYRKSVALLAVPAMLAIAGCSSAPTNAATETGIAKEIKMVGVRDLTGPVAYAGVGAAQGAKLAVDQINEQGYLGEGVKLDLKEVDSAGAIERAASEVTRALSDQDVSVILGPVQGQQSAAVAPVVEARKVPVVFTQSASDGVVIGDYTFRATAPMHTFYQHAAEYLAKQGLKNVAVLYNSTYPTLAELATTHFPEMAAKEGLNIVKSIPVQTTTQDFTSPAQDLAREKPEAIVLLLLSSQSVTAMSQLRQAGYEGQFVGNTNNAGGNAAQAGQDAVGMVYPVDFSAAQSDSHAKKFVDSYRKEFGELPQTYAAEGYDAVWWIAHAIKASGDSSREGIRNGLEQTAREGFTGSMGEITFDGNDMRVPGVLAQWDGSRETVISD
ncbi:ABC transporter substrate-binding protein [Paeniglutamicibacter sp. ORCA_105]|uniref:ABC transporter substrate-binding protein n=1 Tax=Paeniglutamicibacter sp. ORCA_105 TaxID=3377336 RepID=UPI003895EC79